jgi:hypothetical protein
MIALSIPHPALEAKFIASDMPEEEDDCVSLTLDGKEVASIQCCIPGYAGCVKREYSATVEILPGQFFMGRMRSTYSQAASDAVAKLVEIGVLS